MKKAMTIAGSDSGGGAGLQADLKTFAAFGIHGTTAVTAVTAQNTLGVRRAMPVPVALVAAQIRSILEDIGTDAAKTGMLPAPEIVEAVAGLLAEYGVGNVVVDPVMAAQSGEPLATDDTIHAFRRHLLPLCAVVTPNVPEAEALSGRAIDGPEAMERAAREIHEAGARTVLIKGGHLAGEDRGCDLFYDGDEVIWLRAVRVTEREIHGTGCAISAAIAAGLAKGAPLLRAVGAAKEFVTRAIEAARPVGGGAAPVNPLQLREDG